MKENHWKRIGLTIKIICVLFLLFDAVMKIIRESHSVSGTVSLGWPDSSVTELGIILFFFTLLYAIPKTSVTGAILITAYLGGATSTMARIGQPIYFSFILGVFIWLALFLIDKNIRKLFIGQTKKVDGNE